MAKITVYGADWCSLTEQAIEHLRELNVEFDYVDIDEDRKAAKWVAEQNGGKEKKPTLDIDGEILRVPSDGQIDEALRSHGLLS